MPDRDALTTVLLVEDETLVRMHGAGILEDAGYKVLEAGNADEALEVLAQHDEVRLLFSDVDMPGSMDGLALAALVHERWPDIRLLLTSGHHHLDEAEIPDSGLFVQKPWTEGVVIDQICRLLDTDR